MNDSGIRVTELTVSADKQTLRAVFNDGEEKEIPAELLRVESPSAEVQGHNPADKVLVTGKENVKIVGAVPVGNYAVRLTFDDGHDTGIYSWRLLRQMGEQAETMLADYRAAVAAAAKG